MEEERQRKGDNHEEKGAVYFSKRKRYQVLLEEFNIFDFCSNSCSESLFLLIIFIVFKMILMIFLFQLAEYTQAEEKLRKTLLDLQKREKQLAVNEQEVTC